VSAPRVSVIVPVYDTGAPLARALRSLDEQTYRDFEVVVVDDGSTDSQTRALLDAAGRRPGVSVHRTENRGPAHARNLAAERARGSYLLPLDADDWLAAAFLARTVPLLDADPELGVVHTWVGLVGRHHGIWRTGPFALPDILSRCTVHVSSLFRREIWTQVGGFDPRFVESCEDWDFWLGAVERGWGGRCVPEVLVYYRRTTAGREFRSRAPGISTTLMRNLVAKHRTLYTAHVEDALGGMYERLAAAGVALERIYHFPPIRAFVRLRQLLRPEVA
jgi:glycosyltransferase involved in cell wall biosynthesis